MEALQQAQLAVIAKAAVEAEKLMYRCILLAGFQVALRFSLFRIDYKLRCLAPVPPTMLPKPREEIN